MQRGPAHPGAAQLQAGQLAAADERGGPVVAGEPAAEAGEAAAPRVGHEDRAAPIAANVDRPGRREDRAGIRRRRQRWRACSVLRVLDEWWPWQPEKRAATPRRPGTEEETSPLLHPASKEINEIGARI